MLDRTFWTRVRVIERRHRIVPVAAFSLFSRWSQSLSVGKIRPKANSEDNLLSAFVLTIAGAFAAGLPIALAIIWACS